MDALHRFHCITIEQSIYMTLTQMTFIISFAGLTLKNGCFLMSIASRSLAPSLFSGFLRNNCVCVCVCVCVSVCVCVHVCE